MEEQAQMSDKECRTVMAMRLEAAGITVRALGELGGGWGVMHGAEGYPEKVGRDLDILVGSRMLGASADAVADALCDQGWTVTTIRRAWQVDQVIASRVARGGVTVAFEADMVARQVWCGIPLAVGPPDADSCRSADGGMVLDIWGGFVKGLLVQCLAGNWSKLDRRREEWKLDGFAEGLVRVRLGSLAGPKAAGELLEALRGGCLNRLKAAAFSVRKSLVRGYLNPFGSAWRGCWRWMFDRLVQRSLRVPKAPVLMLRFSGDWDAERRAAVVAGIERECAKCLVFPGITVLDQGAFVSRRMRRRVMHASAMGNLHIVPGSDAITEDRVGRLFPTEGVAVLEAHAGGVEGRVRLVEAGLEGGGADGDGGITDVTGVLMDRFHGMNRLR